MREVSAEMMACGTLCWVWRISFNDGSKAGFTDHDTALIFEGLSCSAASGFSPGEDGGVLGVLDSELISSDDVKGGRFDGARIDSFRVNWRTPTEFVHMTTGFIGAITQKGASFEAEVLGESARLERSTGRVFSRLCDASFGDARCGLDGSLFPDSTICPRSFAACRDQFANSHNFRGFPYLLGDDALSAGPQEGELRDGGSRNA